MVSGAVEHRKHIRDALGVREGHVGRGGPVALIVCDDLDAVVFPHADTAVRGAKILTAAGIRPFAFMKAGLGSGSALHDM